jgi:HEAT repeat protein
LAEAALAESELNVAGTLDWALARTGDSAIPVLVAALSSPSPERRRRAVAALTKIGSPRATGALAEAFRHEDPLVRTSAVLARGGLGHADAIGALIDLVAEGRSDVDAADVLGTLAGRHGHADAITEAIAVELERGGEAARQRLVAALADVPGTAARQLLLALTADPDPRVSHTATFLLRRR